MAKAEDIFKVLGQKRPYQVAILILTELKALSGWLL